ncbi:MAG: GyrI-like domain-containing protein [Eubacteriales bacterium]
MELLMQLNNSVRYIEEHICDDIALAEVSGVTAYSPYHFGRLFYYVADMPLSEYIRRRKLSLAAMELQSGDIKVLDLAVKYGYDSADSFTRAFVRQHGITPSAARQKGVMLRIFPPLTFHIIIKGVREMNWRIEEKEAFEVFGIERTFKNEDSGKIPAFWTECQRNGSYDKLFVDAGIKAGEEGRCVINALCGHIEPEDDAFPYMLFVLKNENSRTEGYKTAVVPKLTWAVFRVDGVDHSVCQIPHLFQRAYSEWLPTSGYDKANGPDMEIYGEDFEEVWIPVVRK